jgi:hypothetical protein
MTRTLRQQRQQQLLEKLHREVGPALGASLTVTEVIDILVKLEGREPYVVDTPPTATGALTGKAPPRTRGGDLSRAQRR